MAQDTALALRHQVIYSIFIRNFSKAGTFLGVIPELDRLKDLGVDMIWLMPIHPLGVVKRKGSLGSPYAIQDYRAVNSEFGTMEDFKALCQAIHERGMKVMIDVVYNHTSPDSVLVQTHPEWFYYKPDGQRGNRVGEWTDIVDLDYRHRDLWDYQIETLQFWAQYVDGFRCDVASLVPVDFWVKARAAVAQVNPDVTWLAESVHAEFVQFMREEGVAAFSDSQLYQAFDITYDYDIWTVFERYVRGEIPLEWYLERLQLQDCIYPENYVKLRNLENHDQPRFASLVSDVQQVKHWLAFSFLQRGASLLYNGQEIMAQHQPTLFDLDPVDWQWNRDLSAYLQQLIQFKKTLPLEGAYHMKGHEDLDVVEIRYTKPDTPSLSHWLAVSLKGKEGVIKVDLADGDYTNEFTGERLTVTDGHLILGQNPVLIRFVDE